MRTLPKHGPSHVNVNFRTAGSNRNTYATENNDNAVDAPTNIRTANAFYAVNGLPYNPLMEDALLTCKVTRVVHKGTKDERVKPILPRYAAHKAHDGYYGGMAVKTRSRVDREPTAQQLADADEWARKHDIPVAV